MSKSDKTSKKGNKAEFQRAMGRLEDAVKDLGDAAKDNFADRAAEVLEQTAAKLKSEFAGTGKRGDSKDDPYDYGEGYGDGNASGANFAFGSKGSDDGRLGHWRGEGSPKPYRDLDRGKLWGICAGIAPYLGLEVWVVRCLAVTAFIFAPQIVVPAYLIGYFVLDERSELDELMGSSRPKATRRMRKRHARAQRAEERAEKRKAKRDKKSGASRVAARAAQEPVSDRPLPARNVLRSVRGTLNEAELRLRRMEGHVTSGRYELQKELRKIEQSGT